MTTQMIVTNKNVRNDSGIADHYPPKVVSKDDTPANEPEIDMDNLGDMYFDGDARHALYKKHCCKDAVDNFVKLDINNKLFTNWSERQITDFINDGLPNNKTITTIHFAAHGLIDNPNVTAKHIETLLVQSIPKVSQLNELHVYRGNCTYITNELLEQCIRQCKKLHSIALWQVPLLVGATSDSGYGGTMAPTAKELAGTIRMHPNIQSISIDLDTNFSNQDELDLNGAFDLFIMAIAGMPKLKSFYLRCKKQRAQQRLTMYEDECIISTEAMILLMNSNSIEQITFDNVGINDEHIDVLVDELKILNYNKTSKLSTLNLKYNKFSDDVLYTFGQLLPINTTLQVLDLSGTPLSTEGGIALAKGIVHTNYTLLYIDFDDPTTSTEMMPMEYGFFSENIHYTSVWMKQIKYQLRMNRAYNQVVPQLRHKTPESLVASLTKDQIIDTIIHVADHVDCIDSIIRLHAKVLFQI